MTSIAASGELSPVSNEDRINSMDVTRGIALLGILLMNITGFLKKRNTPWSGHGVLLHTGKNNRSKNKRNSDIEKRGRS